MEIGDSIIINSPTFGGNLKSFVSFKAEWYSGELLQFSYHLIHSGAIAFNGSQFRMTRIVLTEKELEWEKRW